MINATRSISVDMGWRNSEMGDPGEPYGGGAAVWPPGSSGRRSERSGRGCRCHLAARGPRPERLEPDRLDGFHGGDGAAAEQVVEAQVLGVQGVVDRSRGR